MRRQTWSMVGIMGTVGALLFMSGCAAIDAGFEGVLVEQPFFFGHGGIDATPPRPAVSGLRQPRGSLMWMFGRCSTLNTSTSFRLKNARCRLMRS